VVHPGDDPTAGVRLARGAGLVGAPVCGAALGTGLDAGDVDGDGYDDLIIGLPGLTVGRIQVVFGSPSGLSPTRQTTVLGPTIDGSSAHFGSAIAAGDFNCDGYADVAVGAPDADVGAAVDAGSVSVFLGRSTGISPTGTRRVQSAAGDAPENGDRFGYALAAGDLDTGGPEECGCDDLAISATFEDVAGVANAGLVHVLFGGTSGPGGGGTRMITPTGRLGPFRDQGMGSSLGIGDIDLDGVDDLSMTLSATDQLAWMSGGARGLGPVNIESDELALGATCDAEAKKGTVTITDIKITFGSPDCAPCCGPGDCCIGGSCGGD
jgi:hypothetical protein